MLGCQLKILDAGSYLSHLEPPTIEHAAACDVGASNLTRNHPQRGRRMPAAWPCANIALTVEATLAKTIMVSSNIEALRLGRDGVHSTDKTFTIHSRSFTFTIVRLEYQIHALPSC